MNHKEKKVIIEVIKFLNQYLNEHFDYEEKFMEKNNFYGLKEHKEVHQSFIKEYEEFKKDLDIATELKDSEIQKQKITNLAVQVESFLGNWWIDHIGKMDQKYAKDIIRNNKN